MRGIFILSIVFFISISCSNSENGYIIKGVIDGSEEVLNEGKIYMLKQSQSRVYLDSAILRRGKFLFEGYIESPDKYVLYIEGLSYNIPIYLENAKFRIRAKSANLREAEVIGGETQSLINMSSSKSREVMNKYNLNTVLTELMNEKITGDRREQNRDILERANAEMKHFTDSLIAENPCSNFALLNLLEIANILPLSVIEERFKLLKDCPTNRLNDNLNKVSSIIEIRRELEPGEVAPGFNIIIEGKSLKPLYDVVANNEFTLLFFWASWNHESVEIAKALRERYRHFLKMGVDIIAVSVNDIDSKRDEVIREERFEWINIKDKDLQNQLEKYNIITIPHIFLLDSRGIIISNNLKITEIDTYLGGE